MSTTNEDETNAEAEGYAIPPKLHHLIKSLDRAPVPFCHFGKSQTPPRINASIETLISASMNALRHSDDSSFHQFLSAKQAADLNIEVHFPCLDSVVQEISTNLLQGRRASADLEAICIQSKGSSLTTHQNSLSKNGHVALLYVAISGDWRNADEESGFIVKRCNELYRGNTFGPGAYAVCYPSELVVLDTPDSDEDLFRVTIVYSVIIQDDGRSNLYKVPWISQPQSSLSQLNPDVGEIIISYLGVREMINLSQSCKQFKEVALAEQIVTKMIIECKEELMIYLDANNGTDMYDLAIPLQWGYFTYHDAKNNNCEGRWLFGLDYVLYKSCQNAFPHCELKCRKAILRCVNGQIGNKNLQIIQAATEWELNFEDISEPIDLVFPLGKKWTLETWNAVLHISDYFQRTYDDEWEAFILWPFFFTRFIIGKQYFRRILNRLVPYSGFEVENEQYSVYLYRSSCVMIKTKAPDSAIQIPERGINNDEIWIVPAWIDD